MMKTKPIHDFTPCVNNHEATNYKGNQVNSFSLKNLKIFVLIPIVMLCTSCVLESNIRIIPESEKGVSSNIQGTYVNRKGEVSVVRKVGKNEYRFSGPKEILAEAGLSGAKKKKVLADITEELAKGRRSEKNRDVRMAVRLLEESKAKIEAGKEASLRDDVYFTTSSLERGWFIAQISEVLSGALDESDLYLPHKFDIFVGRYMNNSLNIYTTDVCVDPGLAKRYKISFVGNKITKYHRFSDFKKFMWACIKEKQLKPKRELFKL